MLPIYVGISSGVYLAAISLSAERCALSGLKDLQNSADATSKVARVAFMAMAIASATAFTFGILSGVTLLASLVVPISSALSILTCVGLSLAITVPIHYQAYKSFKS